MIQPIRRTKIIATLGPATDHKDNLKKIIISGADIVRLNFSHGKITEHFIRARKVREIASQLNKYIAIIGDLQGPKIRISTMQTNEIYLKSGDKFLLNSINDNKQYDQKYVRVNYKQLSQDVSPGDCLLLDDGKIQLKVISICNTQIYTKVIIGGILSNNKGINKLGGGLSAKILTDKDKKDIIIASKIKVDYLAISFPRNSIDLHYARKLVVDSGSNAKIISKIERAEAVQSNETIDDIIKASDAVMVARGDLGIEIGASELARMQKKIIHRAQNLNRPVIIATQMMESMIMNSTPTRAEIMDVSNAVLDGTDAVMLSAETATGQYPSETVTSMSNVCVGAEKLLHTDKYYFSSYTKSQKKFKTIEETITKSSMYIANYLETINAIIFITDFDRFALLVSRIESKLPIFILSKNIHILNVITLYKGVIPMYFNHTGDNTTDSRCASNLLRDKGFILSGDLVMVIQNNIKNEFDIINMNHILKVE